MTIDEIIKLEPVEDTVKALKEKGVVVPKWSDLEKEYDPRKHPVRTDPSYIDTVKSGKTIRLSRITLNTQKLATKRMTQLCFGIPVTRLYSPSSDDEKEKRAAKILEKIFAKVRINSINIKRFKEYFCACEMATIWYAKEEQNTIYGEPTKLKLRCRYFSPRLGENIYPLFDDFGDMIALSFEYARKEGGKEIIYFDTYTSNKHLRWKKDSGDWSVDVDEDIKVKKIPGQYIPREEPVWEDTSGNTYEQEWSLSRSGNYLRKNSRPLFAVFADEDEKTKIKIGNSSKEGEDESLAVMKFPEKAKAEYVSWEQAIESLKYFNDTLYRQNFTQIQLPDISFDNMKAAPMSGEARQLMFTDAILKVTEESGDIIEFLDREVNVVKAFAKIMFPDLSEAFDTLGVENVITPFTIKSEKEKAEVLTTLTGGKAILSVKQGVKMLNYVEDHEEELKQLASEDVKDINGAYDDNI